jgi:hypothetical protein
MIRTLYVPAVLLAVVVSGCSLLLTFDRFGECRDGACAPEAFKDAGQMNDASLACTPRKWPGPVPDNATGPETTRVYALRGLQFNPDPDSGVIDYDLNDRCVCPAGVRGTSGTCKKNALATCDGALTGADNQLSALFKSFALFDPTTQIFSDTEATNAITRGEFSILFRIEGYNGTANDGLVSVALYNALRVDTSNQDAGIQDSGARDGGGAAGDAAVAPTFEPNERWVVDRAFLVAPPSTKPKFLDVRAYVSNGTLVANFGFVELGVVLPRLGRFVLRGTDVRLTLPLPSNSLVAAAGTLTGRIPTTEIVRLGGRLGWCPGTERFVAITAACASADLNEQNDDDGNAPCNAISTNMHMQFAPTLAPVNFDQASYSESTCPAAACPPP